MQPLISKAFRTPDRTIRARDSVTLDLRLFLQGSSSSILTESGEYSVVSLLPGSAKTYINWTKDTFRSTLSLSWTVLLGTFIVVKLLTITLFAWLLMVSDPRRECVAHAHTFTDFFFFVTQTIFTIGYGYMSPLCNGSNTIVLAVSILGLFQTAILTGLAFAKFTLDPRRNFSCAFTTQLVGYVPQKVSADSMVSLGFRFVNVFNRHFFNANLKLYLVKHRMVTVNEAVGKYAGRAQSGGRSNTGSRSNTQLPPLERSSSGASLDTLPGEPVSRWLAPTVQELEDVCVSSPVEMMSLPVSVVTNIPVSTLLAGSSLSGRGMGCASTGSVIASNIQSSADFEIMAMLTYNDATTGGEMCVRKSYLLADTRWLMEKPERAGDVQPTLFEQHPRPYLSSGPSAGRGSLNFGLGKINMVNSCSVWPPRWMPIVSRDEDTNDYEVDVSMLDLLDGGHKGRGSEGGLLSPSSPNRGDGLSSTSPKIQRGSAEKSSIGKPSEPSDESSGLESRASLESIDIDSVITELTSAEELGTYKRLRQPLPPILEEESPSGFEQLDSNSRKRPSARTAPEMTRTALETTNLIETGDDLRSKLSESAIGQNSLEARPGAQPSGQVDQAEFFNKFNSLTVPAVRRRGTFSGFSKSGSAAGAGNLATQQPQVKSPSSLFPRNDP